MDETLVIGGLAAELAKVPDPRIHRTRRHVLVDILVIAICGVLCGCDGFVDIAEFGRRKRQFFQRFLELPHGIPSHDTFNRVFARLAPQALEQCLVNWLHAVREAAREEGEVIAIDGKTLRRTFRRAAGQTALHLVSAWATANRLTLGQVAVAEKSNEITAIPQLLRLLDVSGTVVTIDAMGCQKDIAQAIRDAEADYVLAVKGNQETTLELVQEALLSHLESGNRPRGSECKTRERAHGRKEVREYVSLPVPQALIEYGWCDVRSIGMVYCRREYAGKIHEEARYYISSMRPGARRLARAVRAHWGIENSLHWVLDVAFQEDRCRLQQGHAADNLALVNRLAVSLLKADTTVRAGVACKRKAAGWDDDYLLALLTKTEPI